MRPGDMQLARDLRRRLITFQKRHEMPGINRPENLACFIEQLIDSTRRIRYIDALKSKAIGTQCADPSSIAFDPLKAAILHIRNGNIEEAFWLVFLLTHFGKNYRSGWRLVSDVYSGLSDIIWDWTTTSRNIQSFREWLHNNETTLRRNGSFGNHRKYESLNAYRNTGTGSAIASYIEWVGADGHSSMINRAINNVGEDPRNLFDHLYHSMGQVNRFGRTARFDYLTMVGKLGLINIEPGHTYLNGATGPLLGARLLFGGDKRANISKGTLNDIFAELDQHLGLYYGMQVLEDSLCNWQKSPDRYIYFGG